MTVQASKAATSPISVPVKHNRNDEGGRSGVPCHGSRTMNTATIAGRIATDSKHESRPQLDNKPSLITIALFVALLIGGVVFATISLRSDVLESGVRTTTYLPFFLLGVALLIALGFEFVNGFQDRANAVATVIYTHSLPVHAAVVWSGLFNFLGVIPLSNVICTLPFVVERG